MKSVLIFALALPPVVALSQQQPGQAQHLPTQQMSISGMMQKGSCNVSGVQGSASITIVCNSGVPQKTVDLINRQFQKLLHDRDSSIAQLTAQVNEWVDRYERLVERQNSPGIGEEIRRQVQDLLKQGKLDEAGQILDKEIDSGEKQVDQIAQAFFDRAEIKSLRLKPLEALADYEKAYNYRPENAYYAGTYASLLFDQEQYSKADPILRKAIAYYNNLPPSDTRWYSPFVFQLFEELGLLLIEEHQLDGAEIMFKLALDDSRMLAKNRPPYLQIVAVMLNDLGRVYSLMHRPEEAEASYLEALQISIGQRFDLQRVASLRFLGELDDDMHRYTDAEKQYNDALSVLNGMPKDEDPVYQATFAGVFYDLGVLYTDMQRPKDAGARYVKALSIYRDLALYNPQLYEHDVASTSLSLAETYEDSKQFEQAEKAFAETLQIDEVLSKSDPQTYLPAIATAHYRLAVVDGQISMPNWDQIEPHRDQIEPHLVEALRIHRDLAKTTPQTYMPLVARDARGLGGFYLHTQKWDQAESNLVEALSIYRNLAESDSQLYMPDVTEAIEQIGNLYIDTGGNIDMAPICKETSPFFTNLPISDSQMTPRIKMLKISCSISQ
jgi:tetratricopeptide (TPR) repeat protein